MIPKFRAWDLEEKKWIYEFKLGFSDIDGSLWYIEQSEDDILYFVEDLGNKFELMQSTGLKDKNGVEVFEGDIIKCSSGCPHEVIFKIEHGGNVLGGMPTFYLSDLGAGYQWMNKEEVIGNIYDNPELLEGE